MALQETDIRSLFQDKGRGQLLRLEFREKVLFNQTGLVHSRLDYAHKGKQVEFDIMPLTPLIKSTNGVTNSAGQRLSSGKETFTIDTAFDCNVVILNMDNRMSKVEFENYVFNQVKLAIFQEMDRHVFKVLSEGHIKSATLDITGVASKKDKLKAVRESIEDIFNILENNDINRMNSGAPKIYMHRKIAQVIRGGIESLYTGDNTKFTEKAEGKIDLGLGGYGMAYETNNMFVTTANTNATFPKIDAEAKGENVTVAPTTVHQISMGTAPQVGDWFVNNNRKIKLTSVVSAGGNNYDVTFSEAITTNIAAGTVAIARITHANILVGFGEGGKYLADPFQPIDVSNLQKEDGTGIHGKMYSFQGFHQAFIPADARMRYRTVSVKVRS